MLKLRKKTVIFEAGSLNKIEKNDEYLSVAYVTFC